jgi:predicted permease
MVPLLAGNNWGQGVTVEGYATTPDSDVNSRFNAVGAGYFRTLGVPLLAGREFDQRDVLGAPRVAIVNETFARKFELGRDAVGRRMATGVGDVELDIEIIGLVQDLKYSEVKDEIPPVFYLPSAQDEDLGFLHFYVRTEADPEQILGSVRRVVSNVDPSLPIEDLQTLPMQVRENLFLDRMLSRLSASFALLATLLAAIGLYGVIAYSVAQRTREIGLRMALGADGSRIRRLILRHVSRVAIPGAVLGVLAALGLGRLASSLLFELEGHDPTVFAAAAVLLLIVTFGAGLVPARRAARIDPNEALRAD